MKSSNQVLANVFQQMHTGNSAAIAQAATPSASISAQHVQLIDDLFGKLLVLFPVNAPSAGLLSNYKPEWLKTLAANGVASAEAIQRGLMKARLDTERKFWPSPLQFARWCKPEPADYNLPAVDSAYREAVKNYRYGSRYPWSHQIVLATIHAVGVSAFKHSSDKELFSQFSYNYEMLIKLYMEGQDISVNIPKALPKPGETSRRASLDCEARLRALNLVRRFSGASPKNTTSTSD